MRLIVTGASGVLGSELIRQTMETAPQTEIVAVARQPAQLPQQTPLPQIAANDGK